MGASNPASDEQWVPDNPDGSGWADVDWSSSIRGTRYHYKHGLPYGNAISQLPTHYRVVTRLESLNLEPHENSYFVARAKLADFVAELTLAGGAETIWHIEPCADPPAESRADRNSE